MYNPREVQQRLDMLLQKLNGILAMLKATGRLQAANHEKLTKAITDDDFEEVVNCWKRFEAIERQLAFEKQLYQDTIEEGRRTFLVAYGPQGAEWWDKMIAQIGSV